jgi:patatin-like phospholipase
VPPYSPERRTALVLTGTGAHGAYHAGALRALQEAGVKIDLVAGHGVGAGSAALAAIDGGARLWDADGIWRSPGLTTMYGWRRPLPVVTWLGAVLVAVLLIPLVVLLAGLLIFLIGFFLEMIQVSQGAAIISAFSAWLQTAFAGTGLPTLVPRAATIVLAAIIGVLASVAFVAARAAGSRRMQGGWWWRMAGAPLDARAASDRFADALWELIRGAASVTRPGRGALGRRFSEVLVDNLGQPGFRELLLVATDLDARRDVVAALLIDPHRQEFLAPRVDVDRRSEVLDLTGVGRDHAFDMIAAALTPPLVSDPHLLTFASDSFWRGETHRMCDRPGALQRLLEEVAAAGARQVVIVSGIAPAAAPHRLRAARVDLRGRYGDFQAAAEAVALRDAIEATRVFFDSIYVIQPAHNAVGPYDFGGAYDEGSDRVMKVSELAERAYEDTYRQFIEPVVGASGEQIARRVGPARMGADAARR